MALIKRVIDSPALPKSRILFNLFRNHRSEIHSAVRSASNLESPLHFRGFSCLLTQWVHPTVGGLQTMGQSRTATPFGRANQQQVRHVYVEVLNDDLDQALKIYKRKMRDSKVEDKLKEKRFYSKPSERRKLAKHYKKLNRARRELGEKIQIVKNRMEKIREVRKINKEEKRAKAAGGS